MAAWKSVASAAGEAGPENERWTRAQVLEETVTRIDIKKQPF
jgi:hypothetical protein